MREVITSRRNPAVIKLCGLSEKKNREAERLFRFDGLKLYLEGVAAGVEVSMVFLRESSADSLLARITSAGAALPGENGERVIILADSLFDSVSEEKSPEGIITAAKYIDKFHKTVTIYNNLSDQADILPPDGQRIILLEDIRDPGNLGTILRTAGALGVGRIYLTGDCADIYNPKTLRASMGAVFKVMTVSCRNRAALIGALRSCGRRVFAAALDAKAARLGDITLAPSDCVAIGNEGHGLSREVIEACDGSIMIPMAEGHESLNASIAAALFMWEGAKAERLG